MPTPTAPAPPTPTLTTTSSATRAKLSPEPIPTKPTPRLRLERRSRSDWGFQSARPESVPPTPSASFLPAVEVFGGSQGEIRRAGLDAEWFSRWFQLPKYRDTGRWPQPRRRSRSVSMTAPRRTIVSSPSPMAGSSFSMWKPVSRKERRLCRRKAGSVAPGRAMR